MGTIFPYEVGRTLKRTELDWTPTSKALPRKKKYTRRYEYSADYQQSTLRLVACEVGGDSLYEKFKRLLNEWQEESIFMSSMTEMVMLRSYQAIIGMGPSAVRMILNELKHNPDYLFWALEAITGDNPVLPEDEGQLDLMANAWVEWGRKKGIIE